MTITVEHEYRTIDKSGWGDGPWKAEPDKIQWTDAATGLPCLACRHPSAGHWCGYVGIPPRHPYYGKDWGDLIEEFDGGLTYADVCQEGPEDTSICHIPQPGQPDHVWWLGFDCAHSGDLSPGWHRDTMLRYPSHRDDVYRDLPYVQQECGRLAAQLAALATVVRP